MEKFVYTKHGKFAKKLPFSYLSLPLYLDFKAYVFEKNKEPIIVWQDLLYLNDFPSIFLPRNKKNWERLSVSCATEDDIKKIEGENIKIKIKKLLESEYFYRTVDIAFPKGRTAKKISRCAKKHEIKLFKSYSQEKIKNFYFAWKKQRERGQELFVEVEGDELFFFTLNNLKKYKVEQLYVEIDGKLAGLAWAVKHPLGGWTSLQLKTLYKYCDLSHFLRSQMAQKFKNNKIFTTGTACHDDGIRNYKTQLKPFLIKNYYYLFTEEKSAN